jgi:hypothetical protein
MNPISSEIAGTMAARRFFRVATVCLHPIADLHRNQRGRHDLAFHPDCGELPAEHGRGRRAECRLSIYISQTGLNH